ncbi:MAG: hypothetical protein LBM04_03835, partial [Opitutaceae bacterium]|nr:hypothetical protein [Opitutaceae bacterium]
ARWRRFLKLLEDKCKVAGDVDLLLEFVAGDSESQLLQDAATLKSWLAQPQAPGSYNDNKRNQPM